MDTNQENHPFGVLLADEMGVRKNNSSDCRQQCSVFNS